MDHEIYGKPASRNDLGIYATRRYPKGTGPATIPSGPTQPTDPNANPVTVSRVYGGVTVVPHAATDRWEYIVPPKRRARLQSARTRVVRRSVAAPATAPQVQIVLLRSGAASSVGVAGAYLASNAVGDESTQIHPGEVELFEGDKLYSLSEDTSTGGTVDLFSSAILIEYDNLHPVVAADYFAAVGVNPLSSGSAGGLSLFKTSTGGSTQWKYPTAAIMTRDRGGSALQVQIAGDTGVVPRELLGIG